MTSPAGLLTVAEGIPCLNDHETTHLQQQLLQHLQGSAAYNEEDGVVGPRADVDALPILHGACESEEGEVIEAESRAQAGGHAC